METNEFLQTVVIPACVKKARGNGVELGLIYKTHKVYPTSRKVVLQFELEKTNGVVVFEFTCKYDYNDTSDWIEWLDLHVQGGSYN